MTKRLPAATREEWIEAFVSYVARLAPGASPRLLAAKAELLYPHLGGFGPIEVAEAEWEDLPLGGDAFPVPHLADRPRRSLE